MSIGSLIVKIGADITGIRRGASKGAQSLKGLEGATKTLGTALKGLAIGLTARELVSMVNGAMKAIDATAKLSRQLGGTIDGLQGLRLAAADAGVNTDSLKSSMEALNEKLGEAARAGAGEAYEALKRLGLSARELGAMDLDERMAAIADAIREAGLSSQGTQDALAKMGVTQGELVLLMQSGGEAIRAARQEIEDLGLSLSDVDAAKVEAANDAMERVKLASTAVAQRLAVALSPVITEISNQFIDAAKDAEGLRGTVDKVVKAGVLGLGYLGDAVRGVHLVFKTVELAGWDLGTTIVKVFQGGVVAISSLVDSAIGEINGLIAAMNMMPGIDITPIALMSDGKFMTALDELAKNFQATSDDVFQQLKTLATTEWPSDKAKALFNELVAASEAAARDVVENRRRIMDLNGDGDGDDPTERERKEAERLRERLSSQLNILREHAMTAEQLENERHNRRLDQLKQALDQELVALDEFTTISEGLERRHMEALERIRKDGMDRVQDVSASSVAAGVKQITGMLSGLTSSMASENKTMFDIHKGFAIADALISGAQGVAQTMGAYPMPWGLPFVVAHAAMAAAQVGIIASQQFRGGGRAVSAAASYGGGASAGGGPRSTGPAAANGGGSGVSGGAGQLVQIGLTGDTFSRASVLSLIEEINEAVADGARIAVV